MGNRRHNPHKLLRDALDRVERTPCMDCPDVFFPEDFPDKMTRNYAVAVARKLCSECPIKTECFIYAQETNERYGIWGGTLPNDR